ncbi:hypothetical protein EV194_11150 [Natronoflexus pectinivorans]|uniref:Uncharacterized protein n=1 Tax=Natronoflexus pectinivorans TaxID=682526 RepID=A0A4V2RW57_9BACT|nr:hypothetical protein EV194_11150 [Natronoflexus pectinivorans]
MSREKSNELLRNRYINYKITEYLRDIETDRIKKQFSEQYGMVFDQTHPKADKRLRLHV